MEYKIQNTNSEEWNIVKDFINERISIIQKELETDYDQRETTLLRGKIAFAREVLRLGDKEIAIKDDPVDDYE